MVVLVLLGVAIVLYFTHMIQSKVFGCKILFFFNADLLFSQEPGTHLLTELLKCLVPVGMYDERCVHLKCCNIINSTGTSCEVFYFYAASMNVALVIAFFATSSFNYPIARTFISLAGDRSFSRVLRTVVVFALNRSFYATTSAVPPVSFLILHPRQIQIMWSQTL